MRLLAISLLGACETAAGSVPSPLPAIAAELDQQAQLVRTVARAARAFRAWPRVDDTLRAAPIPCDGFGIGRVAAPESVKPSVSAATEGDHARKLFYLRTNNELAYRLTDGPVPPGFMIVKEAFAAVAADDPPRPTPDEREGPYHLTREDNTVVVDGQRFRAGPTVGLFVMAKVDALQGTDEHWIYGTVSTEEVVMSAGRIASCMTCHEDATHERLFGL